MFSGTEEDDRKGVDLYWFIGWEVPWDLTVSGLLWSRSFSGLQSMSCQWRYLFLSEHNILVTHGLMVWTDLIKGTATGSGRLEQTIFRFQYKSVVSWGHNNTCTLVRLIPHCKFNKLYSPFVDAFVLYTLLSFSCHQYTFSFTRLPWLRTAY